MSKYFKDENMWMKYLHECLSVQDDVLSTTADVSHYSSITEDSFEAIRKIFLRQIIKTTKEFGEQ